QAASPGMPLASLPDACGSASDGKCAEKVTKYDGQGRDCRRAVGPGLSDPVRRQETRPESTQLRAAFGPAPITRSMVLSSISRSNGLGSAVMPKPSSIG